MASGVSSNSPHRTWSRTGRSESGPWCWPPAKRPTRPGCETFRKRLHGTPVKVVVQPAFGYVSELAMDGRSIRRRVMEGIMELLREARHDECLVWAHNLGLGRNLYLARELTFTCHCARHPAHCASSRLVVREPLASLCRDARGGLSHSPSRGQCGSGWLAADLPRGHQPRRRCGSGKAFPRPGRLAAQPGRTGGETARRPGEGRPCVAPRTTRRGRTRVAIALPVAAPQKHRGGTAAHALAAAGSLAGDHGRRQFR